ncbi:MAG: hypothetical protein R3F40_00395 [Candidatus Competibacteraceae bacterium]
MLIHLIPESFAGPGRNPDPDLYRRVLAITDFVSGMTDSYAVALFKKLTGDFAADRLSPVGDRRLDIDPARSHAPAARRPPATRCDWCDAPDSSLQITRRS